MNADQVAEELHRVWREDIAIGVEVHLVTRSEAQVGSEFVMVDKADRTYQTGQTVVDMKNPGPIEKRTKAGKHRAR